MPKKYVVVGKSILRLWFVALIIVILIVFIYNQEAAIWITGIAIIIYSITFLPTLIFRKRLMHHMNQYYMIEDDTVAKNINKPLRKIQQRLYELTVIQNWEIPWWLIFRRKKKWLVVFQDKHYIFYHEQTIAKYLELYNKGYNESEILEELKGNDLRTRAEVKIIRETLIKNNRLTEREISVKQKQEADRFK